MQRRVFAILVALTLSLTPKAYGSVARAATLEEKVTSAESIILGRCIETRTSFDPSGRWILTYSTFEVEESWKGSSASVITIVTPGGRLDGLHQETIGVPRFGEGERNVIFTTSSSQGQTVYLFDQGVYEVVERDGEPSLIAPVSSELILVDSQTGRISRRSDERARTLEDFERIIREVLGGPAIQKRMFE